MPSDNVLALLALLLLWLLERSHQRTRSREKGEEGPRPVEVKGWKGVEAIDTLPSRPLAFSATVSGRDGPDGGPSHTVDLADLSCTCTDFQSRRKDLPEEAIGRVCAHVSRALRETGVTGSYDNLLRGIVESGPTRRTYYKVSLRTGETVAVGLDPGSDVVDVVAPDRPDERGTGEGGPSYRSYRYSSADRRWSAGERPPGGAEVAKFVDSLMAEV